MDNIKDKTAIVGIGYTPQGKVPGRSSLSFHLEAARNAQAHYLWGLASLGLNETSDAAAHFKAALAADPNFAAAARALARIK